MSLILDTSLLIAGERRSESVKLMLQRIRVGLGDEHVALSAISVVELTHGIYRAKTDVDRKRRAAFCEELFRDMIIHPISFEIAQVAGRIEGEQAAMGNRIAFEDLMIGATAMHLGYSVASLNVKHFQRIPSLNVVAF